MIQLTTYPRTTYPRTTYPRTTYPRTNYPRIIYPRTNYPRTTNPRIKDPVHGLKFCQFEEVIQICCFLLFSKVDMLESK